jgi:hypothetical protein
MSTHTRRLASTITDAAPQLTWTRDYLANALITGAARHGDWDRIAAVRLVVEHETWLHRTDFRRFIEPDREGYAWLDLAALAEQIDDSTLTRAASSETAILRLACHLVGNVPHDVDPLIAERWSLEAILRPLGEANRALAVEAVRYAALGPAGAR